MEQREDSAVAKRPESARAERRSRVARWARSSPPSCFALVMATGITSHGLDANGWSRAATALLWFGVAVFAVFLVVQVRRLCRRCDDVLADARDPARAFGFFTFAAGRAGGPFVAAAAPTVMGMSAVFWAFGSWLIPVLVLRSVRWEHTRVPLIYAQELWSIVFPIVMHAVATRELGSAFHTSWLVAAGSTETWTGAIIWLIVFLAAVATTARRALRREGP